MASMKHPSHVEHQPVPKSEDEHFSDNEDDMSYADDMSYEANRPCGRKIFIGIAIGIAIGICAGVLIGASIWSQGPTPGQDTPPAPAGLDSSSWLVEGLTTQFLLKSKDTAKDKCESQGSNRVWVASGDNDTKGKCLGRCGDGNRQGADDDNRGDGQSHHDACGRHDHCCHQQSSLLVSPDNADSCLCWEAILISVEEQKDWETNRYLSIGR